MRNTFVHLNAHTDMSISEGIAKTKPLVKELSDQGGVALGVTDINNTFGAIKFYKECRSKGIKPIIGSDIILAGGSKLTLICKNDTGYKNLCKLLSVAYDNREQNGGVLTSKEDLEKYSEGLFCLSGGRKGSVGLSLLGSSFDEAKAKAACLRGIFGSNFLLEVQRLGHPDDDMLVESTVEISRELGIPLVATNGVQFIKPEDSESHEIRLAIASKRILTPETKSEIRQNYSKEQYLKTPEQMIELFKDLPSAVENTVRVAESCNLEIELGKNYLPEFPVPEGMTEAQYLRRVSEEGLAKRLASLSESGMLGGRTGQQYSQRLEYELKVIEEMGFPGYFLIVADFIKWSRENDVPVGPGRGSGAGSLVAYSLGITDLDPLEYDLLFERFLNPERVSMPDFDIDFCMDKRDRVIEYVSRKYGKEAVSQIITFGTMAARSVVRDAARALGYPYGVGNRIAMAIPGEPGTTLSDSMQTQDDLKMLYETDVEVREVLDHALKLEGVTRQVGKHAGGVLIAPKDLTSFTPTYRDPESMSLVSQYDKDDVEQAGLVKFDFLGLRTLTIIDNAVKQIEKTSGKKINLTEIGLDDKKTFELLKKQETTAVFQLESGGMKGLIKRLQPDTIEEVIALVALYRPGPLQAGMVDDFVNRKHGRADIEYLHPKLEPILDKTYGVFVYQEQVMQTAQVLAGYSLGEADMLRRAMGKKKPEEMMKQESFFVEGCIKNGIDKGQAKSIFELMEKFAGYGFNKSHSAAYAYIAYQTAWLKAHYPAEFMSAVLSSDMDNTDKVVLFLNECSRMGINVVPPSINSSEENFTVNSAGDIVFGLGAVKGVGESALKGILEARSVGGDFTSLINFFERTDARTVNKRVVESLIKSGAFDCFGFSRAELMASYPGAKDIAKQSGSEQNKVQGDLFGEVGISQKDLVSTVAAKPWTEKERLESERAVLGLYLTGHPFIVYKKEIESKCTGTLRSYSDTGIEEGSEGTNLDKKTQSISVAGLVVDKALKNHSNKGTSAVIKLDDGTAQMEAMVYSKTYGESYHMLEIGASVHVEGVLKYNERREAYSLIAKEIRTIEMVRSRSLDRIKVTSLGDATESAISKIIEKYDEGHGVLEIEVDSGVKRYDNVPVSDRFLDELRLEVGASAVSVEYKTSGGAERDVIVQQEMLEEGEKTRARRSIELDSALEDLRSALSP